MASRGTGALTRPPFLLQRASRPWSGSRDGTIWTCLFACSKWHSWKLRNSCAFAAAANPH